MQPSLFLYVRPIQDIQPVHHARRLVVIGVNVIATSSGSSVIFAILKGSRDVCKAQRTPERRDDETCR